MKIKTLSIHPYTIPLTNGQLRSGVFINAVDELGVNGWGEIAPLPKWSQETLEDSLKQFNNKKEEIGAINWTTDSWMAKLAKLELLPSVSFGLESALLSILSPLPEHIVPISALLMGSREEILEQAKLRHREGIHTAKLKVGHLSFDEAAFLINQLKDLFRLRIDVNRAWSTQDSLRFFSQFSVDAFDYVEEPFQNPNDLAQFLHPLAVDESFPKDLSLEQLETLPMLKALIYKPTIQGGMLGCLPLHEWATKRGVSLVLSSSFESDLGLVRIGSIAYRLSLTPPIGLGTYHYLKTLVSAPPLQLSGSFITINATVLTGIHYDPYRRF